MSSDQKKDSIWKRRDLVICVVILVALYPTKSAVTSAWEFKILLPDGNPAPNAYVKQFWIDTAAQEEWRSESLRSDSEGKVRLPARSVRMPNIIRLYRYVGNAVSLHDSNVKRMYVNIDFKGSSKLYPNFGDKEYANEIVLKGE